MYYLYLQGLEDEDNMLLRVVDITLKIEAISYSETLIITYQTALHHIPEDCDLEFKNPQMN
jgi:hypothetical protein